MKLFIPPDNDESQEKAYHTPSFRYGVCGPATIAALAHKPVKEILNLWACEFKGHAPMKEIQATLGKMGYAVGKRQKGKKAREFPNPAGSAAIVRIQWLKDDGKEYHWRAATCHTHYVLMEKFEGNWWVFCNGQGWFRAEGETAAAYLNNGYVSSYFEVKGEKHAAKPPE